MLWGMCGDERMHAQGACLQISIAAIAPNYLLGLAGGAALLGTLPVCGYVIPVDDLPDPVWRYPFHFIAFHTYALHGLVLNEFQHRSGWGCPCEIFLAGCNAPCSQSGDEVRPAHHLLFSHIHCNCSLQLLVASALCNSSSWPHWCASLRLCGTSSITHCLLMHAYFPAPPLPTAALHDCCHAHLCQCASRDAQAAAACSHRHQQAQPPQPHAHRLRSHLSHMRTGSAAVLATPWHSCCAPCMLPHRMGRPAT
jgi:hypothetical protein